MLLVLLLCTVFVYFFCPAEAYSWSRKQGGIYTRPAGTSRNIVLDPVIAPRILLIKIQNVSTPLSHALKDMKHNHFHFLCFHALHRGDCRLLDLLAIIFYQNHFSSLSSVLFF